MKLPLLFITFLFLVSYKSLIVCYTSDANSELSTYIVHVQRPADHNVFSDDDLESWHRSFLPAASYSNDSEDSDRLIYSYSEAFSGFAAALTENELEEMSKIDGFVRAYPDKMIPLQTTHTPAFLGLERQSGVWKTSNLGEGVIVGVLDTGILPGHPSFSDDGLPPPPKRWKGHCDFKFGCNNKIVGARSYTDSKDQGPIDNIGHGSHTASIIAGNFVTNINPFGLGNGTMVGMAPHAHLAIYQVCGGACNSSAILAGFDDAIKDGVDILSLSLGLNTDYDQDPVAIGAFMANKKGITVVCASGNYGQNAIANDAPWILTAAATTIDRSFRVSLKLDNGEIINGESTYQPYNFSSKPYPLLSGSCFDLSKMKGKILLCASYERKYPSDTVLRAGGVGMIVYNAVEKDHTLAVREELAEMPGAYVTFEDGMKIQGSSTISLTFNHTVLGVSPAPVVASFSSQGPSIHSPGILKPDISAPGVNIIAAYNTKEDEGSQVPLQVLSGTSMAAPHVSGVAALIKSVHPDWSPAAIRSALITSSDYLDHDGKRIKYADFTDASFYASGAGHLNPSKAVSQGLVYDTQVDDYVAYLCHAFGESNVSVIVGARTNCSNYAANVTDSELNYPTITVRLQTGVTAVKRTVTNVGEANAVYKVKVDVPKGVKVFVEPDTLQFTKKNEKKTFTVTVSTATIAEGNLMWISGETVVRSALVIRQ